jgi:hypothetical protein
MASFIYLLTILFIYFLTNLFLGLKLLGSITWSWWWVLSPLWIGIPSLILVTFLAALVASTIK